MTQTELVDLELGRAELEQYHELVAEDQAATGTPELVEARTMLAKALVEGLDDEEVSKAMVAHVNAFQMQRPDEVWAPDATYETVINAVAYEVDSVAFAALEKYGLASVRVPNEAKIADFVWSSLNRIHVNKVLKAGIRPHIGAASAALLQAVGVVEVRR